MPAIAPLLELSARSAANSTSPAPLQVVCAFPVSGQYGAGSRIVSPNHEMYDPSMQSLQSATVVLCSSYHMYLCA